MAAELEQLRGTWQAVRIATAAGPVPDEVTGRLRYVFTANRVTLLEDRRPTGTGTIALHPTATPKEMDVAMSDGPGAGQVVRGIYECEGTRLRLCIGPERPAAFGPVGPASVVELERVPDAES